MRSSEVSCKSEKFDVIPLSEAIRKEVHYFEWGVWLYEIFDRQDGVQEVEAIPFTIHELRDIASKAENITVYS